MPGKVIAITGANGGLGRALAKRFADDGEQVVLLARKLDKLQEVAAGIGENAMAVACELTSPDSVKAAFAEIAKAHPKLDVLINSAAIFQPFLIEEASDDQIMQGILTNLAGPVLTSRSAIPMMQAGGHILNVSSESVVLPFPHLLIYRATKAGLENFSLGLNDELRDKGIRVSVVRAGQMFGPGSSLEMEPVATMRFMEAAAKNGLRPMERGITAYDSTTGLFRHLVDLPPDMHVDLVTYQGRRQD